jgi:hypothetical protein
MMRMSFRVSGVAAILCLAAGCGPAERESGPSSVAEEFSEALAAGDAAAACASLAEGTLESLTKSEDQDCEASLASLDLPSGAVREVAVWGDRAQVRTDADVLFLTEFSSGWKVTAAGCEAQGERPYQCEVSGS